MVSFLILQKREVEYDKYQMDYLTDAKAEFRVLLKETKLITYKSRDLVNESERHYKDIITVLKVCLCVCLPGLSGSFSRMTDATWFWTAYPRGGTRCCWNTWRRSTAKVLRHHPLQAILERD